MRATIATFILASSALLVGPTQAQLRMPGASGGAAPGGEAPPPSAAPQGPQGQPQADPLTREFRDCIQKAQAAMQAKKADDPAAIHGCLTGEIKRQDAKLAGATQKALRVLPPEGKKRLETANTDWRRFRGSECGFLSEENAPPPGNLQNADCRLRMTTIRAMDMENLAGMLVRQEAASKAQQEAPPPAPAGAASAGEPKK
jgi:uncharacterized protein YecT (DUF1311 family)